MALAYFEPGVTVREVVSPNVAPLLASPANVCVVGRSQGFRRRTDQITLTDTTGTPNDIRLPGLPATADLSSVEAVKDALDPSKGETNGTGYAASEYEVDLNAGTVARAVSGDIAADTIVNVTYTYLPSDYFVARRFDNFSAVEDFYGSALSSDGNSVNSELSFAAQVAFENGAATVTCQPLFTRATPGDPSTPQEQPNAGADTGNVTTWQDTLYSLRDIEDINVLVPAVGQSHANVNDAGQLAIHQAFQDHVQFMRLNDQYILLVGGEDSSGDVADATPTTMVTHAVTLAGRYGGAVAQQTVIVGPSRFERISPVTGRTMTLGGQYAAAAFAGMLAARPVSASLTRKQVSGFAGVPVPMLKSDKNALAQAGITVIEQAGTQVRVRHAITLDATTTATREVSIVRAKHRMIESVRDTIDTNIIGEVIADDQAPLVVRSAVIGVLERLVGDGDIVGYQNVDARTLTLDPTTIEVRFSYRPAFPVNYVNIVFSLDLTGGGATVVQT